MQVIQQLPQQLSSYVLARVDFSVVTLSGPDYFGLWQRVHAPLLKMNLKKAIEESAQEIGFCLKDKQIEAISTFCSGRDIFVSLPTGYGKSVIYGVLPLVFDRIKGSYICYLFINILWLYSFSTGKKGSFIVCVSPLTAIMMTQKAKFTDAGLSAEFLGEAQTDRAAWQNVIDGKVQLVYVSPETIILNSGYRHVLQSAVYKENLIGIAVDEAHCVKSWWVYLLYCRYIIILSSALICYYLYIPIL